MFEFSVICFLIAIILCVFATVVMIAVAIALKTQDIAYKPIEEVIESSYINNTFIPVNNRVFIKNADNLLHGNKS